MRFKRSARAAFSRLEIGVVLANLILFVLLLIPAFRPAKPLELAPRSFPAEAPGDGKTAVKDQ